MHLKLGKAFCFGFIYTLCSVYCRTYFTADEQNHLINITLSAEKRLTRFLLQRYKIAGKEGRPVYDSNTTVPVQFSLGLIQMDLDEKEKVFTTSMWTRMFWIDQYLTWDESKYDGIKLLRFDADQIWIPDVMLLNTADVKIERRKVYIQVRSNGQVQWFPHQIFSSSCSVEVTNFPFDSQACHMWFGSWTHNRLELNLTFPPQGGLDLKTFREDFTEISAWEIYDTVTKRIMNESDPYAFIALTYEIKLRRKLSFTCYILTMPCIFLAALTLIVFCLPPERPDRTGLAMSLFSSFLLLLLILVEAAPPTASSVPKLGLYYCFNMVLIMLSIFLSSLVVNINKFGEKGRPPKIVKTIFLDILSKVFCVTHVYPAETNYCGCTHKSKDQIPHHKHDNSEEESATVLLNNHHKTLDLNSYQQSTPEDRLLLSADHMSHHHDVEKSLVLLQVSLYDVRAQLTNITDFITKKKEETAKLKLQAAEWKNVSRVCDRLFFILYFLAVILSLLTLFPRPQTSLFSWP